MLKRAFAVNFSITEEAGSLITPRQVSYSTKMAERGACDADARKCLAFADREGGGGGGDGQM